MLTWSVRVWVVSVSAGRGCLDESVINVCRDITTSHKMDALVSIFMAFNYKYRTTFRFIVLLHGTLERYCVGICQP